MHEAKFSKSLAKYYHGWFRDCHDSAVFCSAKGWDARAERYLVSAKVYFDIIINNWDAIEYFSVGDRAFLIDTALPEEFRGY